MKSEALTEDQQKILEQRGYLKPEEIHKLAAKAKAKLQAEGKVVEGGKASCHSDFVDPDEAKKMQGEQLVQLNTAPAHGIAKEDRLI